MLEQNRNFLFLAKLKFPLFKLTNALVRHKIVDVEVKNSNVHFVMDKGYELVLETDAESEYMIMHRLFQCWASMPNLQTRKDRVILSFNILSAGVPLVY